MSVYFQWTFFVRPFKLSLLTILSLSFLSGCGGGGSSTGEASSDSVAPIVTLNGASNVSLLQWDDYSELGAIASDDQDGVVTIDISGSVDNTSPGVYTINYSSTDSSNNTTTITRRVEVLPQRPFITTWKTDNEGVTNNNQIKIGTQGTGYTYQVDWGDGSVDENIRGNIVHTYSTPGTYSVAINGLFPQIYFSEFNYDNQKLLSIDQWGDIRWKSMKKAFLDCINMVGNATDIPNLSDVTDLSEMFSGSKIFNQDISNWDVSSITNMSNMFNTALAFNQDVSSWDVSSVTNMKGMFNRAYLFNQDISNWDVSTVTDMSYMFVDADNFNQNIRDWDTSSLTNIGYIFYQADGFNQNISAWDVSNVADMSWAFAYAVSFNQPLNDWNVSSVKNMSDMFRSATSFNQDISSWDVSAVEDMSLMFASADAFNQDIGAWEVSSVTDMQGMFSGADRFNQNIGTWDISSVTNLRSMFYFAESFDQNLGDWDVSSVSDMTSMFFYVKLSTSNYDSLLLGWSAQNLNENLSFHGGKSLYSNSAKSARDILTGVYNWSLQDGGVDN